MSRPRITWRFALNVLFWVGLAGFVGYRVWPQAALAVGASAPDATPAATAGPAYSLTTLNGHVFTSNELRGRVVLVNFWATWCPPCRFEMPGFESVYQKYKDRGFVVLGVSMDAGGEAPVKQFLADHHITYPVAMASGPMMQTFGNPNLLPTSFLIDQEGRVRGEVQGVFASAALQQAVDRLLGESVVRLDRDGAQ